MRTGNKAGRPHTIGLENGSETMKNTIQRFQHDESGSTAIEYGFIALIIGLGIVASLQTIPPALSAIFASVGTYVN